MSATAKELAARIAARLDGALADAEARSAAVGLDASLALSVGDETLGLVRAPDGFRVVRSAPEGAAVHLRGDVGTWTAALAPRPPPGFQSITALRRHGHVQVEGDPAAMARALHLLERIVELLRGAVEPPAAPGARRDLAQIEGRYHELALGDRRAVVYAERAGRGIPVVFLHTAGADGRQFQGILADVELARRYQLWAFDLPMHGRSMPPPDWDGGRVELTQESYARSCAAFLGQVVGRPAVVAGCSMGAAMTLVLAAEQPALVRGAIAIEAPFRATGRRSEYLGHAAVNAAAHNPSYVRGLMSPVAPEPCRRAAAWIYGQAGLGIYGGDLAFYEEFDGAAVAPRIDAARTPVALLTGAYDYSATPEDAARLGRLIPGATVEIMRDLGHFPMVEHPDLFRTYFVPTLARVAGASGATP